MFEDQKEPPYGALISFSRVQGQATLFSSPFVHQGYVSLKICQAKVGRSLSNNWHFPGKEYIEVKLSYSQFAEAITSLNVGCGVPCTLSYLMGERIESPELESDRPDFDKEIDEATQSALETIKELAEAISEEKMSKKAQERLIGLARNAIRKLNDSLPFIASQYAELLDGIEQKAKTEIAAYADMVTHQAGLNALKALMDGENAEQ